MQASFRYFFTIDFTPFDRKICNEKKSYSRGDYSLSLWGKSLNPMGIHWNFKDSVQKKIEHPNKNHQVLSYVFQKQQNPEQSL